MHWKVKFRFARPNSRWVFQKVDLRIESSKREVKREVKRSKKGIKMFGKGSQRVEKRD